jgi:hypothetical protein
MICVLMKGKTKIVIASPNSAGWLEPGDEDYPYTVYKTSGAFIKRWKDLEKAGYKLVRFDSSKPKRKKRTQKYTVKVSGANDPLLGAFAGWLKRQVYGSIGYFELVTGKIPARITGDVDLAKTGRAFASLPDGSLVACGRDGKIKLLDSEGGKPKLLAGDLRAFLGKLAKGRTGVSELDDDDATGRKDLAAWLAKFKGAPQKSS